ncbi:hypothetical protein L7F22_068817 [Adiantum nelumboides]|nr:hypothetical protein [Adiantum nelumboides]
MTDLDVRKTAVLVACLACKLAILVVLEYIQNEEDGGTALACGQSPILPLVQMIHSVVAAASLHSDSKRRRLTHEWWVKPRSAGWANRLFSGLLDITTYRTHFRMSPSTMEWLCQQVAPLVERMDTHYRQCVPVKKRVAMALFRLATGAKYSEVAEKFGLGESTAFICTRQLCDALCSRFKHYLAFPKPESLARVIRRFENLSGLFNCCGAVDCTRFKIRRPAGPHAGDYYDGNMFHSVITQLVVDSDSRILNIAAGFTGGTGDAKVLQLSALYDDVQSHKLLNGPSVQVGGLEVPQYFVGDAGLPLLPWLMVPFEDTDFYPYKMHFNQRHSIARQAVLRAFASLRKWRIFGRAMSVDVKTAVSMIGACSILHNMLLHKGEPLDLEEDHLQDYSMHDSLIQYDKDYVDDEEGSSEDHMLAFHIRDALAMGMEQNGQS